MLRAPGNLHRVMVTEDGHDITHAATAALVAAIQPKRVASGAERPRWRKPAFDVDALRDVLELYMLLSPGAVVW